MGKSRLTTSMSGVLLPQLSGAIKLIRTATTKQRIIQLPLWRVVHPIKILTPPNEKDTRGVVVKAKCIW